VILLRFEHFITGKRLAEWTSPFAMRVGDLVMIEGERYQVDAVYWIREGQRVVVQ
jgi:hypothetical protein